ncbi:MAG: hypothetical protein KAG82_09770 [Alcanivoracaceae bacterium]|nr:hypothetical protein [Alcanivoracaceae bacterium]
MTSKRFLIALLPMLALLLTLPAQAAVEAGRILFARGTVSIVDANESARGGSVGSVFYEGDRVVTGNKSIVQLRLSDGALTALRSNSDYHIQRQRFDEPAQVYEQAGRLVAGWMRSVTGAIGAKYPGNVQQGTSVATIGIRGTTYQIIHVPPEGLPEFPNLQPGSYVYLEDGQIEVSNEAGSRIVSPGQVVRITAANVAPELMPDLVELFQSQLLSSLEADDGEGFNVRDLLENQRDQIVNDLGSGTPTPFLGTVSGVGAFGGNLAQAGRASSTNLSWTGEGSGRYVEAMILDAQNSESTTPYDLSENGLGSVSGTQYRQIQGANGVAAQVHWGLWTEGHFEALDFSGIPLSPTGIWHYMFADNALENGSNDITGLGLTGRYAYNYIGGTELNAVDSNGLPTSQMGTVDSGRIVLDFGTLNMDIDMSFDNGVELTRLVGSGNVDSFYNAGIDLGGTSGLATTFGRIGGTFVGQQAEGIISAVTVEDLSNSLYYYGTAAFQRELGPARIFGGAFGVETLDGRSHVLDTWRISVDENASGVFASEIFVGENSMRYFVTGSAASPTEQLGGVEIYKTPGDAASGVATEVYWGIWDATDYAVTDEFGQPSPATSDWHYMVASNPLSESMVSALGLTGTYDYNFVNGTPLREVSGATGDLAITAASLVTVDFDNLFSGGIQVDVALGATNLVGSGSVFDLYGTGISLTDVQDPIGFGSLAGTFAGNQAEALATVVTYDYNTESYIGTALFEKDPTPVVVP